VAPSLFIFRGNDQGVRFEVSADVLGLGRDASNAIQLHDTEVSRRHAEIRRTDKKYVLADLGSSNGTYVNGKRVDEHVLTSGDEVQLGGTQLLYTAAADDSSENLAEKIDIITRNQPGLDRSRIVRSMSQEQGSGVFDGDEGVVGGNLTGSNLGGSNLGGSNLAGSAGSRVLARAGGNLQVMYRTALAISHTLDIDQLLDRIMHLIFEWVEADRGCVMLVNLETKDLEPRVRHTRQGVRRDERISISKTILDYVLQRNEGVLTSDAQEDDRWNPAQSILHLGVREAICVPLQGRYGVVGAIYIDTLTSPQRMLERGLANKFNDEHLKLMIAIANQAALAIEDTQYYSAMVQAERLAAVGQTIATLSHHIKNILQGIRGGSFLIKEGLAQHDEKMVGKGWEFVEKNQDRISHLVMDMLTFSKEREPELAPADLNQVVGDVIELMSSRAAEKGVELVWKPSAAMPSLTFDPEGMHRAVLNIVTNAIDACESLAAEGDDSSAAEGDDGLAAKGPGRAGRVHVSTHFDLEGQLARIAVEDNGPGIPEEDVAEIFSLFVSRKGSRGTGLGLPVSEKIVKEHGGRILVDSQVGRGSRFTLELPIALPDAVRQTGPLPAAPPGM
jgi:signal transduction histidine kinase